MLRLLKILLLIGIALAGAAFVSLNPGAVTVHFYLADATLPLGLLLLVAAGAGVVAGILVGLASLRQLRHENRRLRREMELAREEVRNLRTIPLRDR